MRKVVLTIILTLAIFYIVPFVVYSIFAVSVGLRLPQDASVSQFLIGVLVSKLGTAIAFVLIFYLARDCLSGRWLLYAFAWWLMFTIGELGQAIGPDYSWTEAVAGVISETVYFPLAALVTNRLLTGK